MHLFLAFFAALPAVLAAPILKPRDGLVTIPDQWIVKFHQGTSDTILTSAIGQITTLLGVEPHHTYDFGGFRGLAIRGPAALLQIVSALGAIEFIEPDSKVFINDLTTQETPLYGLARVSHRATNTPNYIYDDSAGAGTYSYIIDTGIYTDHHDFGGRATFGANFAKDGLDTDGNGHGTHVAGTTGGTTYGVAKKTNLIAVKVLDSEGSGALSQVLAGINWAVADARAKGRIGKAVANLSLGGILSLSTNHAAAAAVKAGLFLAVAAGNDGLPAFTSSPASTPEVCTVGATDQTDARASFSNFGALVDIFAPGVNITSAWIDGPDDTNTISGTSMATPHITGLGAYLLSLEGSRTAQGLCQRIQDLATKNVISNPGPFSPNLLAYNGNGA